MMNQDTANRIVRGALRSAKGLVQDGYFANVVDIGGVGIAICTDGIGSKSVVAMMAERYDTVGIDCVAMNVNDIVCVGATPMTMVDYIAVGALTVVQLRSIAGSIKDGALLAGITIAGGETAILPDVVVDGFDLSATVIGKVPLDGVLTGADVRPGDAVIAIHSKGIHCNGLTLARSVLEMDGAVILSELLKPTPIYVGEALSVMSKVRALINITGGGLLNLLRVDAPVGFELTDMPPIPWFVDAVHEGNDRSPSSYGILNMGVGFCAIVEERYATWVMAGFESRGRSASRIGRVTDEAGVIRLPKEGIVAKDGRFDYV